MAVSQIGSNPKMTLLFHTAQGNQASYSHLLPTDDSRYIGHKSVTVTGKPTMCNH